MEKILAQEQIDALFQSALNGVAPAAAAELVNAEHPFNFNHAGNISTEQMRSITTVNDLFARNLMHTVGAWLRSEFQVTLVSGEQIPYSEFVARIPELTYVSSLRLEPLGALGLIELELVLASPMVDLLLGGTGKAQPVRALTDIEDLIMSSVIQMFVKELNTAWHNVGLQFTCDKRESLSQISRMLPGSEKILCVSFEVRMPEAQGTLNIAMPAVVLNTMLRRLDGVSDRPRRRALDQVLRVRELAGDATVGAVLQFPPVRLPARTLDRLCVGDVLRLPVPRHATAELRVGGLALGRARPVRMGEHRGARMESSTLSADIPFDVAQRSLEQRGLEARGEQL